ncbi:MAG: RNA methyltransferase [Bdellovibrio sp.]|nr:MAG: RNA methyltransferase [Bdellovibrio sp.]
MRVHPPLVRGIEEALQSVLVHSRPADRALDELFRRNRKWGARDRRFVAESVYELVRWKRRFEAVLLGQGQNDNRPPNLPNLARLISVYGIIEGWDEVPEKLQAEEVKRALGQPSSRAVRHSIPDELDALGFEHFGPTWDVEMQALNERAPIDLRVNAWRASRDEVARRLELEGIPTEPLADGGDGLTLLARKNVFATKVFQEGLFEVQDRASQRVAPFLDPQPGERIIDACAGAGGKSLHLAALMKNSGKILALDVVSGKLKELERRARRARVSNIETRLIASRKVIKRLHGTADRLLLDVPCTGLGVLRRNPDAKWRFNSGLHQRVRELQATILREDSVIVKVGGVMVYSTCSILPTENTQQVNEFLADARGAFVLEEQWSVLPSERRGDGFFAARLRRRR